MTLQALYAFFFFLTSHLPQEISWLAYKAVKPSVSQIQDIHMCIEGRNEIPPPKVNVS